MLTNEDFHTSFQKVLDSDPQKNVEGPSRKIRRLMQGTFADNVQQLVYENAPNIEKWAHELRDQWHAELLSRAAKNRPQHYHDVEKMCMKRTLMLSNLNSGTVKPLIQEMKTQS